MSELKYNEPAERFAPIVEKSLYAGATAVMVPSETGCWVHYVEYCERIANIKSEADKVIAELKEERRWRKCSEEKPPHSGIYLVCIAGHVRTLDTFDSDRNLWRNYNPTHWMPLPSAPKEENK
jgi:hypothetical protein